MELLTTLKKHISYTAADDVAAICDPLFKTFGLNYFDYARVYPDSSLVALVSDRDWHYHFFEHEFPVTGVNVTSGIHLLENYMPEKVLTDAASCFSHHNGVTVFCKNETCLEFFDLSAVSSDRTIIDFYFNNIELLTQFLFYFKDKAAKLIAKAHKERFVIPNAMMQNNKTLPSQSYTEFCNLIKTNKIRMNFKSKEVILSRREYECVLQLARGKTMKETARILAISPRTAEDYLARAKNKTNCLFRSQLIDMLWDNLIK
ncbi:MAG: helix-turn-helix transcriptional regulator [Gammaproteobacteria bacterium]|nr:helix-turn-helix transcriptional regulator [Gammaproteobacteria bacterium]